MIAAPAVDLKGGRCVQLVGGRPEDERISLPDPVAVAERWFRLGFGTLHIVDLDAALGTGDNRDIIARVATSTDAVTQVGGGIRDAQAVSDLLDLGVARAIVGTRAVEDPDWLEEVAHRWPNRVSVAADIRDGVVLRRGWKEGSDLRILDFLSALDDLPLGGILCTDVGREGRLEGIDRGSVREVVRGTRHPLWVSGGVTTLDELDFLADLGAAGAVLGMALYTETMDPEVVGARYGATDIDNAASSGDSGTTDPSTRTTDTFNRTDDSVRTEGN